MKTEELIRYYKANIEAIEKGLNNDSLSADKKFRVLKLSLPVRPY